MQHKQVDSEHRMMLIPTKQLVYVAAVFVAMLVSLTLFWPLLQETNHSTFSPSPTVTLILNLILYYRSGSDQMQPIYPSTFNTDER